MLCLPIYKWPCQGQDITSESSALIERRVRTSPITAHIEDFKCIAQAANRNTNASIFTGGFAPRIKTRSASLRRPPDFTISCDNIHDFGDILKMSDLQKTAILLQRINAFGQDPKEHSISTCAPLLYEQDPNKRSMRRCVYMKNIGEFTGYSQRSLCLHLPECVWLEGDWTEEFELVPSNAPSICNHWCDSQAQHTKVTNTFRIEWYYPYGSSPLQSVSNVGYIVI